MAVNTNIPPKQAPASIASFKIEVEGAPMPDKFGVLSFYIKKSVNKIPVARLVISDGNVAKQKFEASDSPVLVPGQKINILAGYNQQYKSIFKGVITTQSIKLVQGESTQLILELKDESVKLTLGRKNKYFFEKTDKAIIEEILSDYSEKGITNDIQAAKTAVTHAEMVQYFCTDWDFIVSRAEANGQLVFADSGKITVDEPKLEGTPNINLSFGENVYSFEAEMDARSEFKEVVARTWDIAERTVTEKKSGSIDALPTEGNIPSSKLADVIGLADFPLQHPGSLKKEELTAWAKSKLLRSRLSKIRGRAKINGYNDIKPGDIINIENFSQRFNGAAFVSGVMHQITGSSTWFTELQFGFSQEWFAEKYQDIIERPAAGLLPSVNGLVIGVVLEIANADDPESNHRVKVQMPLVDDGSDGTWARIVSPDAGKERGVFFRPEVGDEVILGFLNDDPRQPVVLGSLYSKNADGVPPLEADADNFKKGIYTKSGLKFEFDDEQQSILLETKEGNKIYITDKEDPNITITDKNKNKIEMSDKGIIIESAKDFEIKAKGDIKVEGKNITLSAQSQFKAEGNSGTEVSSGGSTVVKGSVVQIN